MVAADPGNDVLAFASFGGLARCLAWIPLHGRAFGACPKRSSWTGHRTHPCRVVISSISWPREARHDRRQARRM